MLSNFPNVLRMAEMGFLTSYPDLPHFTSCSFPCHVEILNKYYLNSVYSALHILTCLTHTVTLTGRC